MILTQARQRPKDVEFTSSPHGVSQRTWRGKEEEQVFERKEEKPEWAL